eukprot:scaffold3747_cov240-Pinguiococcus_pyrenoidosus.AAC.19
MLPHATTCYANLCTRGCPTATDAASFIASLRAPKEPCLPAANPLQYATSVADRSTGSRKGRWLVRHPAGEDGSALSSNGFLIFEYRDDDDEDDVG